MKTCKTKRADEEQDLLKRICKAFRFTLAKSQFNDDLVFITVKDNGAGYLVNKHFPIFGDDGEWGLTHRITTPGNQGIFKFPKWFNANTSLEEMSMRLAVLGY